MSDLNQKNTSRRAFLKGSAATAIGVAGTAAAGPEDPRALPSRILREQRGG